MKKNVDIIDLFDEEIKKKDKKVNRKVRKNKLKEEKEKEKELKRLERIEDEGFNEYLKQLKEKRIIEEPMKEEHLDIKKDKNQEHINIKSVEKKLGIDMSDIKKTNNSFYAIDILIIIFSIILFAISTTYFIYSFIKNINLISNISLILTIIFYLLSIFSKNDNTKKFFQLLSIIFTTIFMSYNLFII